MYDSHFMVMWLYGYFAKIVKVIHITKNILQNIALPLALHSCMDCLLENNNCVFLV